jgi:hypothetical protein
MILNRPWHTTTAELAPNAAQAHRIDILKADTEGFDATVLAE